jgi:smad nuclear-interacting protein 1
MKGERVRPQRDRDVPTHRQRHSYGDSHSTKHNSGHREDEREAVEKETENFSKSGSLNKDKLTFNGVLLKYAQPPEARVPEEKGKRLFVFKDDEHVDTIDISKQSGTTFC